MMFLGGFILHAQHDEDRMPYVLHSRTPAYKAMAYNELVSYGSDECYDLLLEKLSDSSTFSSIG
jgi:hypothetical protein